MTEIKSGEGADRFFESIDPKAGSMRGSRGRREFSDLEGQFR